MLILTRKINESLMLGRDGEITVKLLNIKGNEVKIGVKAPRNVPVNREEVYKRIQEERKVPISKPSQTGNREHEADLEGYSEKKIQ